MTDARRADTSSIVLRGVEIAYDDVGVGTDVVLFVHGHPFNRSMWHPQVRAAREAGWRSIVPDLRGYGESGVTPARVPLEVFADDLCALLDRLRVARAVMVGLSMGGQVAMAFAARHRERVRGLLLAATSPHADDETTRRHRFVTADRVEHEGMRLLADELLPVMLSETSRERYPHVSSHVLSMMRSTNPVGAAAALRGRADRPGYEDTLAMLPVPALLVFGSQDAYASRTDADQLRALLQHGQLLWLENVGHLPNLEAPAPFNAALTRLLAACSA